MSVISTSGCNLYSWKGQKNINSHPQPVWAAMKYKKSVSYRAVPLWFEKLCQLFRAQLMSYSTHYSCVLEAAYLIWIRCNTEVCSALWSLRVHLWKRTKCLALNLRCQLTHASGTFRGTHTHMHMLLELTFQCFFRNAPNTISAKYDGYYD